MEISTRRASPADAPTIVRIGLTAPELNYSAQVPFATLAEVEDATTSPEALALVAELDGEVVGFLVADFSEGPEPWSSLTWIAVAQDRRRLGAAAALYEAWLADARSRGAKYACAYARAGRPIVGFLERRGFRAGNDYTFVDVRL